jgi:hypothetical protein
MSNPNVGIFFGMMLVLVYVFCYASIVKQQKIKTLNVKSWWR